MKLGAFILPTNDNSGASLQDVHYALQASAVDVFGGFTATQTTGAWRDESGAIFRESGVKYEIAIDDADSDKLVSFARFYGHLASQHCVMVTVAECEVLFVDLESVA